MANAILEEHYIRVKHLSPIASSLNPFVNDCRCPTLSSVLAVRRPHAAITTKFGRSSDGSINYRMADTARRNVHAIISRQRGDMLLAWAENLKQLAMH
jgi:hypothetical protein